VPVPFTTMSSPVLSTTTGRAVAPGTRRSR
jgi:hypothetical protein